MRAKTVVEIPPAGLRGFGYHGLMEVIRDAELGKLPRFLLKPIERCRERRPVQMLRREAVLIE